VWGPDNREAAVRVPSTFSSDVAGSTNAELKASDSSSNPYLALGGLLAAGLDGVARSLDPGEAVLVDPGGLSETERRQRGIQRYPTTLGAALDRLEADSVLMAALGPTLARAYLAVKRSEAEAFGREDVAFETKHHFWKF
jgi:glutamine synthetase